MPFGVLMLLAAVPNSTFSPLRPPSVKKSAWVLAVIPLVQFPTGAMRDGRDARPPTAAQPFGNRFSPKGCANHRIHPMSHGGTASDLLEARGLRRIRSFTSSKESNRFNGEGVHLFLE